MKWQFDVSSFLVLLGEDEEFGYRTVRRRIVEVFAAAPVAGFQTYLCSKSKITEIHGSNYISPLGRKVAPLRNGRIKRTLSLCGMLQDGAVTTYRVGGIRDCPSDFWTLKTSISSTMMVLITWLAFAALVALAFKLPSATWIGMLNLLTLVVWSFILRAIDRLVFLHGEHNPSHPNEHDAVIFMGRRHSAVILEGSRLAIARSTGSGLQLKQASWAACLHNFARAGTMLTLVMVFSTVPNGSTTDQILFIACNLLGQLNTWVGQRLHVHQTYKSMVLVERSSSPSRTHVYAFLLKRFGNTNWVDIANLVPDTEIWKLWRERVIDCDDDPKLLWEQCALEISSNDQKV